MPDRERGRGQRGSSQTDLSGVVFEPGPIQIDRHPLLAGLIASICADLDQDDPKISDPLVSLHLTEALVALLLRAVPHRKVDGEDRLSPAAPYYIVRCEKFLSQNLSRQFSLHELADEVGASARTLSSGFRRFRNTTPMGRLREIRLDRARALLSAGDGTETIGEIATRCGMSHLGRFAHYYAQRFNELPSETQLRVRRMKRFDSAVI